MVEREEAADAYSLLNMVYTFRFFNFRRKVIVVADSLDSAMSVLSPEQRNDLKGTTIRKCIMRINSTGNETGVQNYCRSLRGCP